MGTPSTEEAATVRNRLSTLAVMIAHQRDVTMVPGKSWGATPNLGAISYPIEQLATIPHDEATGLLWRSAGFLVDGVHEAKPYDVCVDAILSTVSQFGGRRIADPRMLLPIIMRLETERVERKTRARSRNLENSFLPRLGHGWRSNALQPVVDEASTPVDVAKPVEWWSRLAAHIELLATNNPRPDAPEFDWLDREAHVINGLVNADTADEMLNRFGRFVEGAIGQYAQWAQQQSQPPPPPPGPSSDQDDDQPPADDESDASQQDDSGAGDAEGDDAPDGDGDEEAGDDAADGDSSDDEDATGDDDETDDGDGDADDTSNDDGDDASGDDASGDDAEDSANDGDQGDGGGQDPQDDGDAEQDDQQDAGGASGGPTVSDEVLEQLHKIAEDCKSKKPLDIDYLNGTIVDATEVAQAVCDPDQASWIDLAAAMANNIARVRGVLIKYLEETDIAMREHAMRHGRIDRRCIGSIINGTSEHVFTRRNTPGDTSVDIVIVIDISASTGDGVSATAENLIKARYQAERAFVVTLIEALATIPNARVGLVLFDDHARLVQSLDDPWTTLARHTSISAIRPTGGTRLAAGMRLAANQLAYSQAERRMIIAGTDGEIMEQDKEATTIAASVNADLAVFTIDVDAAAGRAVLPKEIVSSATSTNFAAAIEEQFRRLFAA